MPEYPPETLPEDHDNGTMPDNVEALREAVVGHRIVSAEKQNVRVPWSAGSDYYDNFDSLVLTLDNGKQVMLGETDDCCAFTELREFLLHPERVDHVITGVGTTDQYETWHIYADLGDVLELKVGWSPGNAFYYGYGFEIRVIDPSETRRADDGGLTWDRRPAKR